MIKRDKHDKCGPDKHTKNRSVKTFVLVLIMLIVAAVLVVLCISQRKALRSLEDHAKSIEEKQQRLVDLVKLLRPGGNNNTKPKDFTEYGIDAETSDDVIGDQESRVRQPRAARRRRRDRKQRLVTDKRKKNNMKGKKKMYGASFVVNPASRYCNFEGGAMIPKPLGVRGTKSIQILCWMNATDISKSPWVTTEAGTIFIKRKGHYQISPTLSLQLQDDSCVDKPGQAANIGFAVYKKATRSDYGQEEQLMRCVTGLRCNNREIWTCTSSRVVYLRADDKLWVRVEGSLKHLARVWYDPAYTSLSIVKI